jgi:hypothetical protein
MTLTVWKSENLFIEVVNCHSCRAMIINNKLENFPENEMQTFSTITCTLYKFIRPYFTNCYIIVLSSFRYIAPIFLRAWLHLWHFFILIFKSTLNFRVFLILFCLNAVGFMVVWVECWFAKYFYIWTTETIASSLKMRCHEFLRM